MHATKKVAGPGVGEVHSDAWDSEHTYFERPKFEILQVLGAYWEGSGGLGWIQGVLGAYWEGSGGLGWTQGVLGAYWEIQRLLSG